MPVSLSMQPTRSKAGKKSKRKDTRPAKKRYWAKRTLETHKVGNLMKHCGMSKQSAFNRWHRERQGRVPNGFLRNIA